MNFVFLLIVTFFLNIPCGYWRAGERWFSWQWLAAIHLPVPIIFVLRHFLDEQHTWVKTPLLLIVYFFGQFVGKKIRKHRKIINAKNTP